MTKQEFLTIVQERVRVVIDWYIGCTACNETLANVNRDLQSVLKDWSVPWVLRARFEGPEIIVFPVPWSTS